MNNDFILINNLITYIEQNDPKNFKLLLNKNMCFITEEILNYLFYHALNSKKEYIFAFRFISILINFGVDPNIIIDEANKMNNKNNMDMSKSDNRVGKSILMLACENSNKSLVKELCESNKRQKFLNVNYYDKNKRNALFYLKGGKEDGEIIRLLVEKKIDINWRDKDDNTALNFLILNTKKIKLIYDLIEIGGANFMIKNKEGKNGMDLIKEKWIVRNSPNNLYNFEDLKPLIQLLKNKLSIKLYPSKLKENNNEIDSNSSNNNFRFNNNNNNLIKLSSLSTINSTHNSNNSETNSNSNSNEDNCNVFLKINPLSLIVDTQFNDNNNSSNSEKIEYYTQMNKNKKYLLNLLKNAENNIKENSKLIQEKIGKKKLEKKNLQNNLKEKGNNFQEINKNMANNIANLKNEIIDIKNRIKEKKANLLKENNNSLLNVENDFNFYYKYKDMIHRRQSNGLINKDYIYEQLKIDLIDFMTYVHNKNEKLENTLHKLDDLIQLSVKNCLGEDCKLKMYGSRATKLCLPWSDIDYVLSFNSNKYIEPLQTLYKYLLELNDKFYMDIKYIASASIPVLKIFTKNDYHKISLDISLINPEHHGEE